MGLVKFGKKRRYWESANTHEGLTGNRFVSTTMSYHKWILIDRCMQAELLEKNHANIVHSLQRIVTG